MTRFRPLMPALLLATSCSLAVDPPEQTLWEATLEPAPGYPKASGRAAAVGRSGGTEASIAVEGIEGEVKLAWMIRAGDCDAPGSRVGPAAAYPELQVGSSGSATVDTFVEARLTRDGRYHVVALAQEGDTNVACGALRPR